ncbi:MAG: TRAP transporter fused permease subunit [Defluviitaleaceae bacterium]|nr:TRAP transporter fused permease subunit [Defluviitaleaceae bacterium]
MADINKAPFYEWKNIVDKLVLLIAVGMSAFHLYMASFGVMPAFGQSAIHWAFVGSYIILTRPLKFRGGRIIDIALIAITVYLSYYQFILQERFIIMAGMVSQRDIQLSVVAVICGILIGYRVLGRILPGLCIAFLLYAFYGHHLTGIFRTVPLSLQRIAVHLYASSDGLYGQTLAVSAQFIFLFVLFGAILEMTGAGKFFVDLAFSLTGKARGGPAQAAIYSSILMGTINGSGAANVVTTGTFTIPLMKKVGYTAPMAGGIEAVASSVAQVMPPVMGAVAFLMAEITGIPYIQIALASLIPCLLYFLTLSISAYFDARRNNLAAAEADQLPHFWPILKSGWLFFTPLAVLVFSLASGYSIHRSAFWAILAALVVGFIKNRANMTPAHFAKAMKSAVSGIAPIAAACLLAGIILGVMNLTGIGIRISGIIQTVAGGNLLFALLLSMVASLVLGMGLPTSAAYIILAIIVAPAVIGMGTIPMAAHMFILYFAALSTITPPVALSIFAAAGIAGSGIWETARDALRLGAVGFVIPFAFVFNNQLLMIGSFGEIMVVALITLLGCAVYAMSLFGWCGVRLSIVSRIILFVLGSLFFVPNAILAYAVALAGTCAVLFVENKIMNKNISA